MPEATTVNDVVPHASGWLATCECGRSVVLPAQETAWAWVLDHPCDVTTDVDTRVGAAST